MRHEVAQDGMHGALTKLAAEAAFAQAAGHVAGIDLHSLIQLADGWGGVEGGDSGSVCVGGVCRDVGGRCG